MSSALNVNGETHVVEAPADTPLLYVLRNDLQLKGTRFGCGTGECGACFVLIDGQAVAACDTPLWSAAGRTITTIEGLSKQAGEGDESNELALHPLQAAFITEQAAQCGYCLSGILISAAALLARSARPSEAEIRAALDRNLCRCGAHNRMVRAVQRAAQSVAP